MANVKAKTINLLLEDGTLEGVISIADSSWNKGELYSAPREAVDALISSDACSRYGVYLLLSEDMVYIGQASDLAKRIKQHIIGKSWWERVVVLTTSDDSLNRSDIDYVEASLIQKAEIIGRLDCDNRTSGNKQKVSKFRQVELEQYLDEALFLLQLIGITVFCEVPKVHKGMSKSELIPSVKKSSQAQIEIREKKEAVQFLLDNGISVGKNTNYSKRQDNRPVFWINPRITAIEKEWYIILNDQFESEIVVFCIPANTFAMKNDSGTGLVTRHDHNNIIDLSIATDSFVDTRSKCDFSPYIIKRIKY